MSDDFAAAASRMYPTHGAAPAPASPAIPAAETRQPVAEPAASAAPASAEPTTPREPWSRWGEQAPPLTVQPDALLPPVPPELSAADRMFNSPLASPQDVQALMVLPDDPNAGFADTPEASAERREAASALHAAGLSRPEVEATWQFVVRSASPHYGAPDADATEAALRREYGADYEANMAAARKLTADIVARSPAIRRHLRDTGLQNDASFIRAVVASAKRRAR